jgi:hypothetical protein
MKKAKTLKILDEATMTYRFSYLHRAVFNTSAGRHEVETYANPSIEAPEDTANRLYANKGAFRDLVSIELIP